MKYKRLVLKVIANIKRENLYKETTRHIKEKLKKLICDIGNDYLLVNKSVIREELENHLRLSIILKLKIENSFIDKILSLDKSYLLFNNIKLMLLVYIELQIIKNEALYYEENRELERVYYELLKDCEDMEYPNNYQILSDNQYKKIEEQKKQKAKVLSFFKQSLALKLYQYQNYSKEESELNAREISNILFNDTKGVNFTREKIPFLNGKQSYKPPHYNGKYVNIM